jgi:uncharacterized protein YyaL (SSP411 family)
VPMMLAALTAWHAEHAQVVIAGAPDAADTAALRMEAARHYRPFMVTVPLVPGQAQEGIARLLPFAGAMAQRDGRATAYVCRNFTCREPVVSPDALARQLRGD